MEMKCVIANQSPDWFAMTALSRLLPFSAQREKTAALKRRTEEIIKISERNLKNMDFSLFLPNLANIWSKYWQLFLFTGLKNTLILTTISVSLGTVLGTLIAMMKMSKLRIVRFIASVYIEVIRGTPILLQLYVFYFVLPNIFTFLKLSQFMWVSISLCINSSAYVSEVIRSGIQAVDPGQKEAALSLGFSDSKAMWFVVVPQAVKNILPALGNEFIMIIKDTSLGSTFFIGDLMTQYLVVKGATYLPIEPLVIVGVIYFLMTFILSKVFGHFEKKMQKADRHSGYERKRKQQREVHV